MRPRLNHALVGLLLIAVAACRGGDDDDGDDDDDDDDLVHDAAVADAGTIDAPLTPLDASDEIIAICSDLCNTATAVCEPVDNSCVDACSADLLDCSGEQLDALSECADEATCPGFNGCVEVVACLDDE